MARHRTPTAVLELRGAFKRNPQRKRARENEPQPEGEIGDPPEFLSAEQRTAWLDLVAGCPEGVLCSSDRLIVEVGARVLAAMRASDGVDTKLSLRLEAILARLGMTPADRSRVSARPKHVPSPIDEFANPYAEFG